jgi:hypothetical protein
MKTINLIRAGVIAALFTGAAIGVATAAPGPTKTGVVAGAIGGAIVGGPVGAVVGGVAGGVAGHEASKPGGPITASGHLRKHRHHHHWRHHKHHKTA